MAKRKPVEKDGFQILVEKVKQAAHDAETVRLVRELCDLRDHPEGRFRIIDCRELYDILNRKPAAKKGGKR